MSDISFHCVTLNFSKVQGGGIAEILVYFVPV